MAKKKQTELAAMTGAAQRVLLYCVLNDTDRVVELMPGTVAECTGMNVETARHAIKELRDSHYIEPLHNAKYAHRLIVPEKALNTLDEMRNDYGSFAKRVY